MSHRQIWSRVTVGLFAGAVALATAASVSAQGRFRWGTEQFPNEGACFYRDANFRGDYFCVRPGETVPQVPRGSNDSISSIRVFGNAEVTVFRDARLRGPGARFVTDVRNLQREGWNDEISSARVTRASNGWGRGRNPEWGNNQPIPREGACFYKDADFRGPYFCVPRGASYDQVPPGFDDQVSSIRVRGSNVMIFADRDFGGRGSRLDRDVRNLRGVWADRISSLRVF